MISRNLARRHLSESQRAAVAAEIANLNQGRPQDKPANLPVFIEGDASPAPVSQAEFGMTSRSAQNFMGVAEKFGAKYEIVSHLEPTALYALASVEPDVQARIEELRR